jgi:hypothetical protein
VQDIKNLRGLQDFLNGTGIWHVLAGIHYNKPTNKFQYDSDSMNVKASKLFPFAQYGGSYTGSYHQADWEANSWLTTEAQNFRYSMRSQLKK